MSTKTFKIHPGYTFHEDGTVTRGILTWDGSKLKGKDHLGDIAIDDLMKWADGATALTVDLPDGLTAKDVVQSFNGSLIKPWVNAVEQRGNKVKVWLDIVPESLDAIYRHSYFLWAEVGRSKATPEKYVKREVKRYWKDLVNEAVAAADERR